jgi:hypothetical protein
MAVLAGTLRGKNCKSLLDKHLTILDSTYGTIAILFTNQEVLFPLRGVKAGDLGGL